MYRISAALVSVAVAMRLRSTPDADQITANIPIDLISADDSSAVEDTGTIAAPNYLPDPSVGSGITYVQNSTLGENELVAKVLEEDVTFCSRMTGAAAILAGCKARPTN